MKHLLIDFENIQPQNLDKLDANETCIWLFVGANQKMLPIDLVQSLLRFGENVHLIRIQKTGKNALDFYLSYYLGRIGVIDPQAIVGILSRDGGYDVLVEHIEENQQAKGILRLDNLDNIQFNPPIIERENFSFIQQPTEPIPIPPTTPPSIQPFFRTTLLALRNPNAFLPKYLHNLEQNLRKYILNALLTDQDEAQQIITVKNIIRKLQSQGLLEINSENQMVTYHLTDDDLLNRVQIYLLNLKPKSLNDLKMAIQKRAEELALNVNEQDIQSFIKYLKKQRIIKQNNQKIEYAPFTESQTANQAHPVNEQMWQKVVAAISVSTQARPQKLKALQNTIKAHTKCNDEEVEKIIEHLQKKNYLEINNNKIIYKNSK